MYHAANASSWVPLWDMVDGPMPRGVLGLGDPDVHVIDGVPTMWVGGFSTTFKNRLYVARLASSGDPAAPDWRVEVDERGRARPLVLDPPRDAWDSAGMHTPSYVPATIGQPARIYYTGRSSKKQYGAKSRYAIGALEYVDGHWTRRQGPLIEGSTPRLSVLEPLVVHDGDRYVMWFQANRHEIGPGELPDYELRVSESSDGITWGEPRAFATPAEGFFDNAVARTRDGWLMVLARGADIHGTGGFPPQGLWVSTATELSADRAQWTTPEHVICTDGAGTPNALARGVYGPGLLHLADPERTVVYATGVRASPAWPKLLLSRFLHRRSLVVPAPFYLSVSAIELVRSAG